MRHLILFFTFILPFLGYAEISFRDTTQICFPYVECKITEQMDSIIFKLDNGGNYFIVHFSDGKVINTYLNEKGKIFKKIRVSDKYSHKADSGYFLIGEEYKISYYLTFKKRIRSIYPTKMNIDINQGYGFNGWSYHYKNNRLTRIKHWNNHQNDGLSIDFDKKCRIKSIVNWYEPDKYEVILGSIKPNFWYRLFH